MKRMFGTALAAACLLLAPVSALAHLVTTGIGPVYDGIALLAGLNGPQAGRWMLFALPLVWLLGSVAGTLVPTAPLQVGPATLSLLVIGAMTAADFRLAPAAVTALALALGLVHGWHNGVTLAAAGSQATGLFGTAAAVFVVAALVAALVVALRRPWTRSAVRMVGSWIGAIGLLLLGWTLSGRT